MIAIADRRSTLLASVVRAGMAEDYSPVKGQTYVVKVYPTEYSYRNNPLLVYTMCWYLVYMV